MKVCNVFSRWLVATLLPPPQGALDNFETSPEDDEDSASQIPTGKCLSPALLVECYEVLSPHNFMRCFEEAIHLAGDERQRVAAAYRQVVNLILVSKHNNCKRLRAPPRQPGRPQDRKGGKRVSARNGEEGSRSGVEGRAKRVEGVGGWGVGGGVGGGWEGFCSFLGRLWCVVRYRGLQLLQAMGGGPTGGVVTISHGERVGLGELLVLDASRQEANSY